MKVMSGSWRTLPLLVALLATSGPVWSQEPAPDPAISRRVARLNLARSIRAFATATLVHGECQVARGRLERRQADEAMAIALQELGISSAVLANPQVRKAAAMLETNLDEACQLTGLDAAAAAKLVNEEL
jgi:hypothetical protein